MGLVDVLAWFDFSQMKTTKILKTDWWGLENSELPWYHNFSVIVSVSPVELLVCQVSLVSAANCPRFKIELIK